MLRGAQFNVLTDVVLLRVLHCERYTVAVLCRIGSMNFAGFHLSFITVVKVSEVNLVSYFYKNT